FFCLSFIVLAALQVSAQPRQAASPANTTPAPAREEKKQSSDIIFNPDATVTTQHEVTIKGQRVPYKAVAGTMPVWDEDGKTIAGLFYTYYERTDTRDKTNRPVVISFNGGPGSASVWMHI